MFMNAHAYIKQTLPMKKYLISYGDDAFASQREFFKETALASAFFDDVTIFTRDDIGQDFAEQVGETLDLRRGGGYWLWKPYFVKKALDKIDEHDVLVYCDAGCMINISGKERFDEYLKILESSPTGTIDFELPHKEYEYTKREIFEYFNSSEEIINSNQLMATVVILRKCAHTTMLVNEWHEAACDNPFLFTDELMLIPQHKDFIANRYDQSVFSIIRKEHGANIIPDETYFLDFLREGLKFPFWATRLRR
jgi:hypothetical protein